MNNPMKILCSLRKDIPDVLIKLLEAQSRIYNSFEPSIRDIQILESARNQMESINSELYKRVLILRYIECNHWEQIAAKLDYSSVHLIHRVHPESIKEFLSVK
jgi:hypothetical protein